MIRRFFFGNDPQDQLDKLQREINTLKMSFSNLYMTIKSINQQIEEHNRLDHQLENLVKDFTEHVQQEIDMLKNR